MLIQILFSLGIVLWIFGLVPYLVWRQERDEDDWYDKNLK